jgi:hypothetical protein
MSASFFAGIAQEEVVTRQFKGKLPLFFRDVSMMGAVFTADFAQILRILPDASLRPVKIFPGRGLVSIGCMQYKDSDIGPYNEVALSIVLQPFVPWKQDYHAYIADLPVTTEVALYGGVDFFNYPKYLADISFKEEGGRRICALRDKKDGESILEFSGANPHPNPLPRGRGKGEGELNIMTLNSYPKMNGQLIHAKMLINVEEGASKFLRGPVDLRLGGHPKAELFKKLKLGRLLQYSYAPKCEAILFKPSPYQ